MSLNETPSANRIHIGFFGRRNAGKSSVVNAVTGQELAVVSEVKGTTTDPVKKAMEILPLGPVVIIDTPGIDDEGALGEKRVEKTYEILNKTHIAVLVADAVKGKQQADNELISLFEKKSIPYIVVYNKSDLLPEIPTAKENEIYVSALENENINEAQNKMSINQIRRLPVCDEQNRVIGMLTLGNLANNNTQIGKSQVATTLGNICNCEGTTQNCD